MEAHNLEKVTALRRKLHETAELSMQETRTKQCLMDFLRQNTDLKIEDRGEWFYTYYHAGDDRPVVLFRADFDAIAMDEGIDLPYASKTPGVSHKCGHDGHSAILSGLALEIAENGSPNNVIFLFQPGEETGEGAERCLRIFDEFRIDAAFALHNMPGFPQKTVVLRDDVLFCASKGIRMDFKGAASHASEPEAGRNPAFAIADIVGAIPRIFDRSKYRGLVLCTVVHFELGERAFGISPGEGSLWLTCRGQYRDETDATINELLTYARERAKTDGIEISISEHEVFPETENNPKMAMRVREVCAELGRPAVTLEAPIRASEDFGHFLRRAPGAMFLAGCGDMAPVHTKEYDFPDAIIEECVELFAALSRR
ncbi:MAG: amidohydrolase [Clostridiales Family XIII bacterium]|nr:amidohydrolase [Clostridiales Family XIII bacterium]